MFSFFKRIPKLLILFVALFLAFLTVWNVKAKTPINRPDDIKEESESPWYAENAEDVKPAQEWYLDSRIPSNHIPVPGEDNLFMIVDDNGKIVGYAKMHEDGDSLKWEKVNPDIPDNYEPVKGVENVYKVTSSDGKVSYYKYIRNADDTFAFVPCDEKGNYLDEKKDATEVDKNHRKVKGNVYGLYNDAKVLIGYRQRVKDNDGKYVWKPYTMPSGSSGGKKSYSKKPSGNLGNTNNGNSGNSGGSGDAVVVMGKDTNNSNGTYTTTEKHTDVITEGGYIYTYETTITYVYDQNDNLIETKKGEQKLINKQPVNSTQSRIEKSLKNEFARIKNKANFDDKAAKELFAALSSTRTAAKKKGVSYSASSDATKIAKIKAADMVAFSYSGEKSPIYGTSKEMAKKLSLYKTPVMSTLRLTDQKMKQINQRLQAVPTFKNNRMGSYSQVGIAVTRDKYNMLYVVEVYM